MKYIIKIKRIIVAIHAFLLCSILWAFRDLPNLDGPVPQWQNLLRDFWLVYGFVSGIILIAYPKFGRWLAIGFYSLPTIWFSILVFKVFLEPKGILGEILLVFIIVCFPVGLLFERKSKCLDQKIS